MSAYAYAYVKVWTSPKGSNNALINFVTYDKELNDILW